MGGNERRNYESIKSAFLLNIKLKTGNKKMVDGIHSVIDHLCFRTQQYNN